MHNLSRKAREQTRTFYARYAADPANRVKEVREVQGKLDQRSTRARFDAAGNAARVRDPLNHAGVVDRYHPFNVPPAGPAGGGGSPAPLSARL